MILDFSDREKQVARKLLEGKGVTDISQELNRAKSTIKHIVNRIGLKLEIDESKYCLAVRAAMLCHQYRSEIGITCPCDE